MIYGHQISKIGLEDFAGILKRIYLIPSMRILLDDLDGKIERLIENNIMTVETLYLRTKTKKKAECLGAETGIDITYITVLRRMVSSYIPKPRKLGDYPDLDVKLINKFASEGINNSIHLFDYFSDKTDEQVANKFHMDQTRVGILRSLMTIGQLRYISPVFATILVRSGYDSIEKIANADVAVLHQAILTTMKREQLYKGNVAATDARFLVEDANVFLEYCD